jgi:hypothetical protein
MSQALKGNESKSADKEMFDHMLEEAFERGDRMAKICNWTLDRALEAKAEPGFKTMVSLAGSTAATAALLLAILACYQVTGKHSGRFCLASAPIYFPVGTSSGASVGQPRPIPRFSLNLPWVYISVHPRVRFVVAGQCNHCYSGKVE